MPLPIFALPRSVNEAAINFKNCKYVMPGDDIQAAYDWLKSSDRDAAMGALTSINRRVLVLSSGLYTLSATLTLDTSFVDIIGIGAYPQDVVVYLAGVGTGATVAQTADNIKLSNFQIRHYMQATAAEEHDHAFTIGTPADSTVDNTNSVYRYMDFRLSSEAINHEQIPCHSYSDFAGTWEFCTGGKYSWRTAANKDFNPTMRFCIGGDSSFGGDNYNTTDGTGVINGTFINCIGGKYCFGGCSVFGMVCSSDSYFENCISDGYSFAMGKEFAGTAINCHGKTNCFGATGAAAGDPNLYGSFTGLAIGCSAQIISFGTMRSCFGMDTTAEAVGTMSGIIKNCWIYKSNQDKTYGTTIQDSTHSFKWNTFSGQISGCAPTVPIVKTANYTINEFLNEATFINTGATGTVVLTLPPASIGLKYHFRVTTAQELRISPNGSDTIAINGTQQAAGKYITANAIGELCTLECVVTGQWEQTNSLGTWTAEA